MNIASAPPSDFAAAPEVPELDDPDDPLPDGDALGVALVLPELPLDALLSAACAASGRAKAAATAAAIRVFTFMIVSSVEAARNGESLKGRLYMDDSNPTRRV
ncbi:MAG TPA: hypothetical protein VJT77_06830 [Burkholderiales bacterium]|nr:hypothetical protein [Burkholderiales bacterium]